MAKVSQNLRRKVEERANGICEYCRSNSSEFFPDILLECDHIIPTSKGGKNTLENLAFCCRRCNLSKFNETEGADPLSGNTVRLFNPRIEDWNEHFAWSEDYSMVIGLTKIGRATIEVIDLNRATLIEQRLLLYSRGEHPQD